MSNQGKILIVDDDKNICKTFVVILNTWGYEAKSVLTGSEAIKIIKQELFNIVLLDIKLPDMKGIDLINPIKKINSEIEIILITANATIDNAIQALSQGAIDYFIKPLEVENVLNSIKNVLEKQRILREKKVSEMALLTSEKKYREAFQKVTFYKDLLTHDINNVFQSILSAKDLLSAIQYGSDIKNEVTDILSLLQEQIHRGSKLISNIIRLSEIDEQQSKIKPVEGYEILTNSVNHVRKIMLNKKLNISLDFEKPSFKLKGNELLTDVFDNILLNAIRYNINDVVDIQIKGSIFNKDGLSYKRIEFIDNGKGIPDEMKEKIFNRIDYDDKDTKRMGLGLSLVKKILDSYGGHIIIENRIENDFTKGSNFIILIP
jgi:signal transduction histidine kinase